MTLAQLYAFCGVALCVVGLHGVVRRSHLLRKILGLNVMGSGVFLVIGALARPDAGTPDPVPHALIITGIVVAIAVTAFALVLMVTVAATTGSAELRPTPPEP